MSQEHVELFMHYREVCNLYEAHYGDPDYFGDRVETGMRLTKLLAAIPSREELGRMLLYLGILRDALVGAGMNNAPGELSETVISPLKRLLEAWYGKSNER